MVETDAGTLTFQEYFVREQCRPAVRDIRFDGAGSGAAYAAGARGAVGADLAGIIICPSNPWLSVDPILAVPGMREALRGQRRADHRRVAHHRRQGGEGSRPPRSWPSSGLQPDSRTIARHYEGLIDGFVIDSADEALAARHGAARPS